MKCPNCFTDIKARERRDNQCLRCLKNFAFEPKTHPLGLTDTYFSKTADKLSDGGKYYFTPEQFHFALNRKQNRSQGALVFFIFIAVGTLVVTSVNDWRAGVAVFLFWTFFFFVWACFAVYRKVSATETISLKLSPTEFEQEVLMPWTRLYKELPPRLLTKKPENAEVKTEPRGFLLCDTPSAVNFFIANELQEKLGVIVSGKIERPNKSNRRDAPIFVFHDASFGGYEFVAKIERLYENSRKVVDIGLRPHDVDDFKLAKLRGGNFAREPVTSLTNYENKWLKSGFYTPVFALKPKHLFQIVCERIERNLSPDEKSAE